MTENEGLTEYASLSQNVDEIPLLSSVRGVELNDICQSRRKPCASWVKARIYLAQRAPPSSSNGNRWFFWACVTSLACSILNMAAIVGGGKIYHWDNPSDLSRKPLRRPSVYIRLDSLPSDAARAALPPFLDVFPPFFQPVDAANPRKVYPEDVHARFTFNGRVTPWDHNIILSRTVRLLLFVS